MGIVSFALFSVSIVFIAWVLAFSPTFLERRKNTKKFLELVNFYPINYIHFLKNKKTLIISFSKKKDIGVTSDIYLFCVSSKVFLNKFPLLKEVDFKEITVFDFNNSDLTSLCMTKSYDEFEEKRFQFNFEHISAYDLLNYFDIHLEKKGYK